MWKGPKKGAKAAKLMQQATAVKARIEVGAGAALVGIVGCVALVATKMARPSVAESGPLLRVATPLEADVMQA